MGHIYTLPSVVVAASLGLGVSLVELGRKETFDRCLIVCKGCICTCEVRVQLEKQTYGTCVALPKRRPCLAAGVPELALAAASSNSSWLARPANKRGQSRTSGAGGGAKPRAEDVPLVCHALLLVVGGCQADAQQQRRAPDVGRSGRGRGRGCRMCACYAREARASAWSRVAAWLAESDRSNAPWERRRVARGSAQLSYSVVVTVTAGGVR